MNYRHIFHAGNRCDVVKHTLLTLVLGHLARKEKGFVVLDTHAGTGLYDLQDDRAQKTLEAHDGILAVLEAPAIEALKDYDLILRKLNPLWTGMGAEGFRTYPGSPLLAFHMLRPQDRLVACELNPEDVEALIVNSPADKRYQIHKRDGYEALGALVPPPEKRGLVLIDPPYEHPEEFAQIVKTLTSAYRRWATGIYMIWYPIKDMPAIWQFHEALAKSGITKILCAEFIYENSHPTKLSGSGMILINPPWKIDEHITDLFAHLHRAMKTTHQETNVKWLVP